MSKEQNKRKALEALIDSNSLTEAAEKAGISRKTLYNYLHTERDFALNYKKLTQRQAVEYFDTISSDRETACNTIRAIMNDAEQPAVIRLQAAKTILAAAEKQAEIVNRVTDENLEATHPLHFDL